MRGMDTVVSAEGSICFAFFGRQGVAAARQFVCPNSKQKASFQRRWPPPFVSEFVKNGNCESEILFCLLRGGAGSKWKEWLLILSPTLRVYI
jgi:hypothetical protein